MSWKTKLLLLAMTSACAACGGGSSSSPPVAAPPPAPPAVTQAQWQDASRLSAQATFGVSLVELEAIARSGPEVWLEQQFALPATYHRPTVRDIVRRREAGEFDAFEDDIEYLVFARRLGWWHNTLTAEDQLRQRVAFALSQIFVVSDNVDVLEVYPDALATYYDLLLANAFGNYRTLLREVTLSPAMGVYLSHLNNRRADPVANTFPDENFAREVMQLFSIGLYELNQDGTRVLDAAGRPVPTYDNGTIREFAKVFTGLSFGGAGSFFGNLVQPRFDVPMQMFDAAHEPGAKTLLNGTVLAPGQGGEADVEQAIDNLFEHPNVGPFIGRLLIQRLVTSNPSPEYIQRVAGVFNDDGSGTRGNLRAVVAAILLDPEARASQSAIAAAGKLQEPVVRYARLLRGVGIESDDGFMAALGYFLQSVSRQHPLSSPSVFNFYLPDHQPAGALAARGLFAPEFSIMTANAIIAYPNFVDAIVFGDFVTDAPPGFAPVRLQYAEWQALAGDPQALIVAFDRLLGSGRMDAESVQTLADALAFTPDLNLRIRMAIYFVAIAPQTVVVP